MPNLGSMDPVIGEKVRQWHEVYKEAVRRDKAEEQRLDAEDPGWRERTLDGPGSHVSLFHQMEVIAKERGVDGELESARAWLEAMVGKTVLGAIRNLGKRS